MLIDPTNPNWGNLAQDQERTKAGRDEFFKNKLLEKENQLRLQNAIRTAIIEGKLKPKSGVQVNPLDMNKQIDFNQFETPVDYSQLNSVLGVQQKQQGLEKERLMSAMSGLSTPTEEDLTGTNVSPQMLGLGKVNDGQVMAPKGSSYKDGYIYDQSGGRIGEYMPGNEPENVNIDNSALSEALRNKLMPRVGKEDIQRKVFGITEPKTKTSGLSRSQAIAIMSSPEKAGMLQANNPELYKEVVSTAKGIPFNGQLPSQESYTSEQEQLIEDNANAYPDKTREEIIQALQENNLL